jgi:hypothetical protein
MLAPKKVRASLLRLLRSVEYDDAIPFARSQNDFPPAGLVLQAVSGSWTFLTGKSVRGSKPTC